MGFGAIAGAIGGGLLDKGVDAWMQSTARQASEDMYRRKYQIMVADLKKAGLNPMLAYMKDAGTPPSLGGGNVGGDTAQAISNARSTSAQSSLMKMQEAQVAANTDLASAQAEKTRAETLNVEKSGRLIEAQEYQAKAGGMHSDSLAGRVKALLPSEILTAQSEAQLKQYLLPLARNLAEAEDTDWKRYVAPYLKDLESVSTSAGRIAGALGLDGIMSMLEKMILQEKGSRPGSGNRSTIPRRR